MIELRLTEHIWLRAFSTPPKFLATLGTSDTLGTLYAITPPLIGRKNYLQTTGIRDGLNQENLC
jgi:hypothetical protein